MEGKGKHISWQSAYHGTSFPSKNTRSRPRVIKSNQTDISNVQLSKWPPEDVPTFITTDYDAAEWYANRSSLDGGNQVVIELDVSCRSAAGDHDFEQILLDLGINRQVNEPFSDSNPDETEFIYDLIYRPEVRRELEKRGFDGLAVYDPFSSQEIPVVIIWHRQQVKIIGVHSVENAHDTKKTYTDQTGVQKEYDPDLGDWVVTRLPPGWSD
jgi:hypothetical protein